MGMSQGLSALPGIAWRLPAVPITRLWLSFLAAEQGRFVLWLPVFMGCGVLTYFALLIEPPAYIGLKFATAGFAGALAAGERRGWRALALCAAFAASGFASAQYATARAPPIEPDLPMKAVVLKGVVRAVEILPNGRRVTLIGPVWQWAEPTGRAASKQPPVDTTEHMMTRTARFKMKSGDNTPVETGDIVRVRMMLRPPMPPALPGGWDLQRDAFYSGLGASGYALDRVNVVTHGAPLPLAARMQWLRETIAGRVSAVLAKAEGAIAITLLTGAQRGIPEADHEAFRASGLAHLLAVAGLHIGIVMGFALGFARRLMALSERISLRWPTRKIAAVFALAAGGGYLALTGGHVPIVRSFAMACLFTIAVLAGRSPVSLRALGVAGIVLMLLRPHEAAGVSFQMSFSAVLALISGYEALRPWLRRMWGRGWGRRVLSHVVALALTSTLAGTASLPYTAYHFGHIQSYYIFSNILAVPLTAFWVLPLGLIALLLMPFGLEGLVLVPMGWGITLIIWIAHATTALPAATLPVAHSPAWGLAVLSAGIAWLGIWRSPIRLIGIVAIGVGAISPMMTRPPDILLSGDAGLIAFRTGLGVFMQQARGGSAFTREAWLSHWGETTSSPLPEQGWAALGAVTCVKDACVIRPRPEEMAALLVRGPSKPTGCGGAAVVVSAEPARGVCRNPSPPAVDRFTVWKDGPVAIWLGPKGATVLTDRASRGDRPWVPPRPKPRARAPSKLPEAARDGV